MDEDPIADVFVVRKKFGKWAMKLYVSSVHAA